MTRKEYNKAVDDFSDQLYRFSLKQAGNQDLANDIVQESFTRLWQKVEAISYEKCKSYLFTTAHNYFIDIIRKEKKSADPEKEKIKDDYHTTQNHDVQEILDKALQTIPDIQKTVVLLRDYEGYSYQEIGEITNLTEAQVKVYIFRARKNLRDYLVNIDYIV